MTPRSGIGSIDFNSMGPQDFLLIGIVGAILFSFGSSAGATPKRKRKPVSGGQGFLGGIATVAVLGVTGYFAYQHFFPPQQVNP